MGDSGAQNSTVLVLDGVCHAYDDHPVVRGISLSLARGTIACLLGPSGCGKTTVLRCIAGFEPVRSGSVRLAGELVSAPGLLIPPERRRTGMVFQDYALFPHLDVAANVAFGLHAMARSERAHRVAACIAAVGLSELARAYPHELSGGQQQRVAIARAIAPRPEILLLDEPFSHLDVSLRERLGGEMRELIKRLGITAIFVTHDQAEAFAIADEIGIMRDGRIEQWDTPYNLYHRPANRFVADFVGRGVFLPGIVLSPKQVDIELGRLNGAIPEMCARGCEACGKPCRVDVLLRPDDVVHDDRSALSARVMHKAFRGADILYTLELDSGRTVLASVSSHHNHALGERIGIRLDVDHVVAFPPPEAAVQ